MEESLEYRERVRGWGAGPTSACVCARLTHSTPTPQVVCMSLGFDHLVVATPSQCYVYSVHNWNTPHVIDMRGPARMIVQADRHFAVVSQRGGVQLYSYDGRPRSSPKYPGLRTDLLDRHSLSVSGDSVAILDRNDNKSARRAPAALPRAAGNSQGGVVAHRRPSRSGARLRHGDVAARRLSHRAHQRGCLHRAQPGAAHGRPRSRPDCARLTASPGRSLRGGRARSLSSPACGSGGWRSSTETATCSSRRCTPTARPSWRRWWTALCGAIRETCWPQQRTTSC